MVSRTLIIAVALSTVALSSTVQGAALLMPFDSKASDASQLGHMNLAERDMASINAIQAQAEMMAAHKKRATKDDISVSLAQDEASVLKAKPVDVAMYGDFKPIVKAACTENHDHKDDNDDDDDEDEDEDEDEDDEEDDRRGHGHHHHHGGHSGHGHDNQNGEIGSGNWDGTYTMTGTMMMPSMTMSSTVTMSSTAIYPTMTNKPSSATSALNNRGGTALGLVSMILAAYFM